MDGFGSQVIEVALGLAFSFFLLSLVISAAVEAISWLMSRRANDLQRGIQQLLTGKQADSGENLGAVGKAITEHRLLRGLTEPASVARKIVSKISAGLVKDDPGPSYISPRGFSVAVLDALSKGEGKPLDAVRKSLEEKEIPAALKEQVELGLRLGDAEITAVRADLEQWFDDAMSRVSGWYKRWSQAWVCAFAVLVAVGLNVDTVRIAERLWDDDVLREAVATSAVEAATAEGSATGTATSDPCAELEDNRTAAAAASESSENEDSTAEATPKDSATCQTILAGEIADDALTELEELKIPIGWTEGDDFDGWSTLLGWLISALALSLGAPFWFDALGRLARLRTTGSKPASTGGSGD